MREVATASDDERPFSQEYRIVRSDGAVRWVLDRGQLVAGFGGRLWMDGVIFDITERREAEEALRRREIEAARTAELRASRARIVAAADAARRKIERDLHDGAQQRLVTLALDVQVARGRLEREPELRRPVPRPPRGGAVRGVGRAARARARDPSRGAHGARAAARDPGARRARAGAGGDPSASRSSGSRRRSRSRPTSRSRRRSPTWPSTRARRTRPAAGAGGRRARDRGPRRRRRRRARRRRLGAQRPGGPGRRLRRDAQHRPARRARARSCARCCLSGEVSPRVRRSRGSRARGPRRRRPGGTRSRTRGSCSRSSRGPPARSLLQPLDGEVGRAHVGGGRGRPVADRLVDPVHGKRVGHRGGLEVDVEAAVHVRRGATVDEPAPAAVSLEHGRPRPERRPRGDPGAPRGPGHVEPDLVLDGPTSAPPRSLSCSRRSASRRRRAGSRRPRSRSGPRGAARPPSLGDQTRGSIRPPPKRIIVGLSRGALYEQAFEDYLG